MSKTIQITIIQRGFHVAIGDSTTCCDRLEDAVGFARARLARAQEVCELSASID
jgi:hypothetical protein